MYGTTRFVASLGNEVGGGGGMRAYIYIHVTAGGVFFQGSEAKGGRGGPRMVRVHTTREEAVCIVLYIQTYSVCMYVCKP